MARRSTNPALTGLQSATFDPNGMGENAATYARANANDDQYYRNALAENGSGVNNAAVIQQQGGAAMEDPAMKVFLQALHEKNATISPRGGFMATPFETEQRSTFDPSFQTSAVDPVQALAGLSKRRGK